jgi:hypothetical protein
MSVSMHRESLLPTLCCLIGQLFEWPVSAALQAVTIEANRIQRSFLNLLHKIWLSWKI